MASTISPWKIQNYRWVPVNPNMLTPNSGKIRERICSESETISQCLIENLPGSKNFLLGVVWIKRDSPEKE